MEEGGRRCWGSEEEEKEAMFEKALTPSDVGKLNRLVIPKQQAEKYFPLEGDSKGVLLSFEDESGKCWRFRYSYWNSSQSYVLTKGWSRYVKDKRLDAGDVVSFLRHPTDSHRLFITWRRRHPHAAPAQVSTPMHVAVGSHANSSGVGVGVGWTSTPFYSAHPYPTHPLPYQQSPTLHAPGRGSPGQKPRTPVGNSSKVLRLFGVNMECQAEADESGPSTPQHSSYVSSSSSSSTYHHFYQYNHPQPYVSNPHHHMVYHYQLLEK